MKGDRFASDYEQVRRQAGLQQPRFDLDDEPDPAEVAARVAAKLADFHERMNQRLANETEQAAKRKAEAAALTARANEAMRLAEFEAAGVECPAGMKVSLGLLLQVGWRVDNLSGRNVLTRPYYGQRLRNEIEEEGT